MAYDPATVLPPVYLDWLRDLAREARFGAGDRRGSLNLIDDRARDRCRAAVRSGFSADLGRPLVPGTSNRGDGREAFRLELFYTDGPIGMGSDHLELDCHGLVNTHLDGLNHIALDQTFYGGHAVDDREASSIADLAAGGIVTRGVHVDIPAVRGTPWVQADQPVTGDDIERALGRAGVTFEPGDALLLDMGRDRFEAAGQQAAGERRPGIGADGARWIEAHGVSVVCWDFLDAFAPDEPRAPVHMLTWAIGLILVDNCDFGRLRATLPDGRATGALVVGPLPMAGATGCNVNPVVLV
jgi:kynurenine formamidase